MSLTFELLSLGLIFAQHFLFPPSDGIQFYSRRQSVLRMEHGVSTAMPVLVPAIFISLAAKDGSDSYLGTPMWKYRGSEQDQASERAFPI